MVLSILLVVTLLAGTAGASLQGRTASSCPTPGPVEKPVPLGIPIPPLPPGQRPNFIVILTDDQGYDDFGVNNPGRVQTPNLDRFLRQATRFDNFYVAPSCAPTRAALLTGRDYLRTGTVKVSPDWHTLNHDELTMGEIFSAAGYRTSHFGKWHNGNGLLGYEAYRVGFQDSWTTGVNLFSTEFLHNGEWFDAKRAGYKPTFSHELLMDITLDYLRNITSNSSQPFLMFYPTWLIHDTNEGAMSRSLRLVEASSSVRTTPAPMIDMKAFTQDPKYKGVPMSTLKAWALLKYLDDVIGRLFAFLDDNGLSSTTYVMITGDNGPFLIGDEQAKPQDRMPSGMVGAKSAVEEGGIRNMFSIRGPGIPAGVIDSTMLSVTDILPTLVDLAGITDSMPQDAPPFDGISFKHMLLNVPQSMITTGQRGNSLATPQQRDRMLFHFSQICWPQELVPSLKANRQVWKGQPLLSYNSNRDLHRCIAVTYKDYKWMGLRNKLYRFEGGSHAEGRCSQVKDREMSAKLSAAARAWWETLLKEPHSFSKPVFFAGMYQSEASTLTGTGVHERSNGVSVIEGGVQGFSQEGDSVCWKLNVVMGGTYDVAIMYKSMTSSNVTVKFSVGHISIIRSGIAPSLTVQLPPQTSTLEGMYMGAMNLPPSYTATLNSSNLVKEACLEQVTNTDDGHYVFSLLAGIRLVPTSKRPSRNIPRKNGGSPARTGGLSGAHAMIEAASTGAANDVKEENTPIPIATKPPGPDVGGDYIRILDSSPTVAAPTAVATSDNALHDDLAALPDVTSITTAGAGATTATSVERWGRLDVATDYVAPHGSQAAVPAATTNADADAAKRWERLRKRMGWPAGQLVLDHMYSIYDVEGADDCDACFPSV